MTTWIHQMWLDESNRTCEYPPEKYHLSADSWRWVAQQPNSKLQYQFWNFERIDRLFQIFPVELGKYRDFFYNTIQEHIERCDFARYMILAMYGGIYADLKISIEESILDMIDPECMYVLFNIHNINTPYLMNAFDKPNFHSITNAFFVSPRTDIAKQFWLGFLNDIVQRYHSSQCVQENTGPWHFTNYHLQWRDRLSFVYIAKDPVDTLRYRFLHHCRWDMRVTMSSRWYLKPGQLSRIAYWSIRSFKDIQFVAAALLMVLVATLVCK